MTAAVVALYVLGFALPVFGLIRAYRNGTESYRKAKAVREAVTEINAREAAELRGIMAGPTAEHRTKVPEMQARYASERSRFGGRSPSYGDVQLDLNAPNPEPLAEALRENRWNFICAGVGALCATVASIWSLFLVA